MTMPLWRADQPLVLASKSAVRRLVLEGAGIPLECVPAEIDERDLEARAGARSPGQIAELLAREKAQCVAIRLPGRLVLGADQTLALGDRSFSKPADRAAARTQLMTLRGRSHELHSAISLFRDGAVMFEHCAVARLTMRAFSDDFLEAYLQAAGDAVLASVGCYQVEGLGIQLFERIEGDHFTIMGLPLLPLLDFLQRKGLLAA
jgi:nucleoside triphosphate pyrophosphatase